MKIKYTNNPEKYWLFTNMEHWFIVGTLEDGILKKSKIIYVENKEFFSFHIAYMNISEIIWDENSLHYYMNINQEESLIVDKIFSFLNKHNIIYNNFKE